jgi:hypothetical protein
MVCGGAGTFGKGVPTTSVPGLPAHVRHLVQSRATVSTTETGKLKLKTRLQAILKKTTAK